MLNTAETVYLDTSAWNALSDWVAGRSLKWLAGPEYLFSSCNLDEFSLASAARAKELASLAWRISNRKKLLDHVELTAAEVTAHRHGRQVDYFDHLDSGFGLACSALRSHGGNQAMRVAVSAQMDATKQAYRQHLQLTRQQLGPFFQKAAGLGLTRDLPPLLEERGSGSEIPEMLAQVLSEPGLPSQRANIAALRDIDYRALPGTACWVEYHVALSYLAAQKPGRIARPDKGDQVDYRHACYAGVTDVFVTADTRMHEVLSTVIPSCSARVLTASEYLETLTVSL